MSARPIKVLVVDDSLFMRAAIKKLLDSRPEFHVIDLARDGAEGVEKVCSLRPDVVTMDFNMPRKNGVEAVQEIMERCPTPVLMFSAHTRQGARETFDALHAGAFDFVTKPAGEVSAQLDDIADELCRKLGAAARSTPKPRGTTRSSLRSTRTVPAPSLRSSRTMKAVSPRRTTGSMAAVAPPRTTRSMAAVSANPRIVFVGISTGGPVALSKVIPLLPASIRVGIVIVQHMPATFTGALAERLNNESALEVREAKDGDVPCPGLVLIAPGGKHASVDANGLICLTDEPPVHGCRPAADVTMKAAATVYGRRAIGLIMTGMGKDGAEGLLAIKRAGGKTLAQDKESSVIFGMPKAALELDAVDEVVTLSGLAAKLQLL